MKKEEKHRHHLLHWIKQRERIRLRKERGKKAPWTDDKILQQYRFCNVRRMDDKVSQWILNNWINPHSTHKSLFVACVVARHFNKIETLEEIGNFLWKRPLDFKKLRKKLHIYRNRGNKLFNAAYIINGASGGDKLDQVIRIFKEVYEQQDDIIVWDSMEETAKNLLPIRGLGTFMAGQITADFRFGDQHDWLDVQRWAPPGPGSMRGLCWFYNMPIKRPLPIPRSQFPERFQEARLYMMKHLPRRITNRLEAIDYQNCLCEFDKYMRALSGNGKPKRKYPGGPA